MNNKKSFALHQYLESWHTVFVLSIIILVSQSIALTYLFKIGLDRPIVLFRSSLSFVAVLNIVILVWFKKRWKEKYSLWIFYSLLIPLFFVTWSSQAAYVESGNIFTPYLPYKIYPIVLAFLAPGTFLINFLIILSFYVQAIVFWFYYDMPNIDAISLGSEPFGTIVFALVAFTLLIFRFRDKKIIRQLSRNQANLESYQMLTQIFLSLRDKANTPMQIQKLGLSLLKSRHPADKELLEMMENATNDLARINKILEKINPSISRVELEDNLISEEEISQYLERVRVEH